MSEIFASRKFRESGHSRNFACFAGILFRESTKLVHFTGINFREIVFSQIKTAVKLVTKRVFMLIWAKNCQEILKTVFHRN